MKPSSVRRQDMLTKEEARAVLEFDLFALETTAHHAVSAITEAGYGDELAGPAREVWNTARALRREYEKVCGEKQ